MKYPRSLRRLLKFYDEFCKIERRRIIEAHRRYGNDWTYKDNRYERWLEVLDEWGYRALDYAQKRNAKRRN